MPTVANGDHSDISNGKVLPFYLLFNGGLGDLVFPVPPQQLSMSFPSRVTTLQTRRGIHFDDFGEGTVSVTISGSFGWRKNDINNLTGKETFAALMLMWKRRQEAVRDGDPAKYTVTFVDTQDGVVLDCVIPDFQFSREAQSGPIRKYQMTLTSVKVQRLFQGLPANTNANGSSTNVQGTQSVGQTVGSNSGTRHSTLQLATDTSALFAANIGSGSGPGTASYTPGATDSVAQIAAAVFHVQTPTQEQIKVIVDANNLRFRGTNQPLGAPVVSYPNPQSVIALPLGT